MMPIPTLRKKELEVVFELLEVLQSSLDMNQTLRGAYPLLCRLVAVDHGAMCISRTEDSSQYDWTVAEMPESFFRDYAQVAQFDFVRLAVAQKPNIVLCDPDMLAPQERAQVDRHPMVQYSRSNHMRIEQIMAVMFSTDPSWNGGLTLYRDNRHAFTDHERSILQFLTPFFASAMGNCKRYGDLLRWSTVMETSFTIHRTSMLMFSTAMKWVGGSNGVDQALDRCFGKGNRGRDGLPIVLLAELERLPRGASPATPPLPWIPAKSGAGVVVTYVPVVKEFGMVWMVLLDEVPEEWRARLTPTEIDVAVRVAQGWDNALVGLELGISPMTVKTHVYNIFNKLGIGKREVLTTRFKARG
jgi:DNA-binding CsgD family transcriptional regulator